MAKVQKHYVYGCYVDGELKYIGHGVGNRYKHCLGGTSSCGELNRDFYEGRSLVVKKLYEELTKSEAENIEEDLIRKSFDSLYNKVVKYTPVNSKPNVSKKRDYKILAHTWSLDEEKDYYNTFMQSKGIDRDTLSGIEDPLIQEGLCIYIIKDSTSNPMIIIDKVDEHNVNKWHAKVFDHLAHPDGLWDWQKGMEIEMNRY